jgi:hypothetical protein
MQFTKRGVDWLRRFGVVGQLNRTIHGIQQGPLFVYDSQLAEGKYAKEETNLPRVIITGFGIHCHFT